MSGDLRVELAEYLSRNLSSSRVNSISPAVRDYLALQRLNEIFPAKPEVDLESSVQARAALIPINGSKVYIRTIPGHTSNTTPTKFIRTYLVSEAAFWKCVFYETSLFALLPGTLSHVVSVSYTHLTLPTIYSV